MTTAATGRHDIYAAIHKGLRMLMGDTLVLLGQADASDAASVERALARVVTLLDTCAAHLEHENDFVHAAIAARSTSWDGQTAEDHVHHVTHIRMLRTLVEAVETAPAGQRTAALTRLYRELALFVADNYTHMAVEESENNRLLWALYTDEEILGIEHALVASLSPEDAMASLRIMLLAATPADRAATLHGMRLHAPEPVFDATLDMIRPLLAPLDRQKLAFALDDLARAA